MTPDEMRCVFPAYAIQERQWIAWSNDGKKIVARAATKTTAILLALKAGESEPILELAEGQ